MSVLRATSAFDEGEGSTGRRSHRKVAKVTTGAPTEAGEKDTSDGPGPSRQRRTTAQRASYIDAADYVVDEDDPLEQDLRTINK